MVVEISGRWTRRETDAKDWKNGRWWEYGFARRLELPEDANWTKMEAFITDDIFLEIRIPKNSYRHRPTSLSLQEHHRGEIWLLHSTFQLVECS